MLDQQKKCDVPLHLILIFVLLVIGIVTSGTMSPTMQKGIGMGYVLTSEAFEHNEIYVQIRNKLLKARIVKLPFIKS